MPGSPWTSALRIKRKGDPDSEGKRLASANENTNSDREAFLTPRSAFFYWLLQSDQKTPNLKKRIVKNPLSAAAFGQNKALKLCQNNIVINKHIPNSSPYSTEPFPIVQGRASDIKEQSPSNRLVDDDPVLLWLLSDYLLRDCIDHTSPIKEDIIYLYIILSGGIKVDRGPLSTLIGVANQTAPFGPPASMDDLDDPSQFSLRARNTRGNFGPALLMRRP